MSDPILLSGFAGFGVHPTEVSSSPSLSEYAWVAWEDDDGEEDPWSWWPNQWTREMRLWQFDRANGLL